MTPPRLLEEVPPSEVRRVLHELARVPRIVKSPIDRW